MSELLLVASGFLGGLSLGILVVNEWWSRYVRKSHAEIFDAWERQMADHYEAAHGLVTRRDLAAIITKAAELPR